MHLGKHAKNRGLKRLKYVVLYFLIFLVIAYPFIEPHLITIHHTAVENTAIPSGMRPLRIVFVSDIHMQSWPFFSRAGLNSLVRKINAQNPDLVLLGGDYGNSAESTEAFFRALPPIRANYGVFAVLGEHDRPNPEEGEAEKNANQMALLKAAMVAKNVTPLVNDVVSVRIGTDTTIQVAGLDDIMTGSPNVTELASKCQNEQYVIFMCHNPEIIPDAQLALDQKGRRNWFDLGLFGHTHGGQNAIWRDLFGISPNVPDEYTHGILTEGRATLVISNGIGTSVMPMRLLCPPEIHVITVTSPK